MTTPKQSPPPAPDDTEINEAIAASESLVEALFEIAEKYGADVTNNLPRWQNGVYLREVAEFIEDVQTQVDRHGTTNTVPRAKYDTAVESLSWGEAYWKLTAIERRRVWFYSGKGWRGWPMIGDDEYQRRTLALGLPFVGAVVIALWRCRCADCTQELAQLREFVDAPREDF